MVLADGARAETFESLLAAGDLPQISRHVVERGSYRLATSTFTSTTGPAHIPLLTGCYPGTVGVPGYRWFDRDAYRGWGPAAPHALRSYNGPEVAFLAKDMDQAQPTLYELMPDAIGVFGLMNRGLAKKRNLNSRQKPFIWSHSHWFHDYTRADRWAGDAMVRAAEANSRFRFVAFPGIDWNCHYIGQDCPESIDSYRGIDSAVGRAADALSRKGTYEETLITIVSDHGHRQVDTHFDLAVEIGRVHGIRTAYHSWPAFRLSFDCVVCVSGNGMAHIYLKGEDGSWRTRPSRDVIRSRHAGLLEWLVAAPAVDIIATRGEHAGDLVVESRRGIADLRENRDDARIRYSAREDGDPFGFSGMAAEMSAREALEATIETEYPDALTQVTQLFRTGRTGDIVVSASPGFDLRERFERPQHFSSHGGLIRDHMLVPFASSVPLSGGPARTADIATTVLDYLDLRVPPGVDGSTRLIRDRRAALAEGAAVASPASV